MPTPTQQTEIQIKNARSHNLRGVDCRIPLGSLTVVTGVSGSGKSTLAFDTLYAEGQRRYVSSLSTYARQFLERLAKPEVDSISSLPPAIAIEQRNRVTQARSTVGTASEVLDHLRLLFTHAGETWCSACDRAVETGTVAGVAGRIARTFAGQRLSVTCSIICHPEEQPDEIRDRLVRDGFGRATDRGGRRVELVELDDEALPDLVATGSLLIDRISLQDPNPEVWLGRLSEAVESAFAIGDGSARVRDETGGEASYHEGFVCEGCGCEFARPEPALFSFNSPLGACADCQGFGRTSKLDLDRVIPDPTRALADRAIAPFATKMGRVMDRELLAACTARGVPTDVAWQALADDDRAFVIEGDEDWGGVQGFFDWLEGRRYKVQARVLIARYRGYETCVACRGSRLCDAARAVRVKGVDLGRLSGWTLAELRAWSAELSLDEATGRRAHRVLSALSRRLDLVVHVGLGYVTLDRQIRTLSGGEAQRIQLATALSGGLTASLYVLDEPTIGLHPRDIERLLETLRAIRDSGNTVVVVEHAQEVIECADHILDLGPGAGRKGGSLVVTGSVADVKASPDSKTGQALRGELLPPILRPRQSTGKLRIAGLSENNLVDLQVNLPLGILLVVTGVSGAGKSTLLRAGLVDPFARAVATGVATQLDRMIDGNVVDVVVVDQSPASRSPRSNCATLTKAFDGIRKAFASTREAKRQGLGPGWFSFNVPGGRCDACEGAGEVVVDMQFLDDVRVPCDECGGRRYRREVLDVRLDGRSIVDVLDLTIEEACEVFSGERSVERRLAPLVEVGLGYLTLGQPLSTLSGGENQRVRLGLALGDAAPGHVYVLDEPTTGLHQADVAVLLSAFETLLGKGASLMVVEHNLDVIARAHHIVDMGPDGGPLGGQIVAEGDPATIARTAGSHTGHALRTYLERG